MKLTLRVRLRPSPAQAKALAATLERCNEVSNLAAQVAQEKDLRSNYDLRKLTYAQARAMGLSSQIAQHAIKKVADALATRRANARNGRYGKPDSQRYQRIMTKPLTFNAFGAQTYDDRVLSWNHQARTVSVWTLEGRLKDLPFDGRAQDLALIASCRKGESDLLYHNGNFFLAATVDVPEPEPEAPNGFLGMDAGVVNLAVTQAVDEDGNATGAPKVWSGGAVTARRKKNVALRARLQRKGTKSAKRLLKKRSGKESRWARDVNHQVSKEIVAEAKRTGRGVSVEKLTGIRDRVRHRKPQRATFHSWAFAQLGGFLEYKARAAGVPFVQVDPAYTSQACSGCGCVDKKNRSSQERFLCISCGLSLNADTNAALNIARSGLCWWLGPVNGPYAARSRKPSPSGLGS